MLELTRPSSGVGETVQPGSSVRAAVSRTSTGTPRRRDSASTAVRCSAEMPASLTCAP